MQERSHPERTSTASFWPTESMFSTASSEASSLLEPWFFPWRARRHNNMEGGSHVGLEVHHKSAFAAVAAKEIPSKNSPHASARCNPLCHRHSSPFLFRQLSCQIALNRE